jgi:hypothetical protein
MDNPEGDIMQGTGGIRVLYIDLDSIQIICMIDLFPKGEKENLSKTERNEIKKVVKGIQEELRKNE